MLPGRRLVLLVLGASLCASAAGLVSDASQIEAAFALTPSKNHPQGHAITVDGAGEAASNGVKADTQESGVVGICPPPSCRTGDWVGDPNHVNAPVNGEVPDAESARAAKASKLEAE